MQPQFRSASPADLDAIEQLLVRAGLPTAGIREMIDTDASQFIVATAPDNPGELVAVAGVEECCEHALLRSVAVRDDWQKHGLGHELVKRAVCRAEERGINALYLLTLTAEHYFPRFGFEPVQRDQVPQAIADTLEFKSACPATAVAMTRRVAVATA